jgi:tetratricopeptide (TPR) repeat protein
MRGKAVTTLDLAPLTPEEARELVDALGTNDPTQVDQVLERADGNPLFIEQLLRCPVPGSVPAGISMLVQARADQLAPEDRSILQAASALGQRFTLPALSQVLDRDDPALDTLLAQSLIVEDKDGYAFVHALVRNAVYHALTRERRVRLHENAARYYAGRDAPLHAEHLERAEDDGAAAAYLLAANSERRAGKLERAFELCARGHALAERARDRHATLLLMGELSLDLGRSEAALDAFTRAQPSASDAAERARCHVGRAAALRVLDRSKEALLELTNAERLLDPQRELVLLSRIHYLRGNALFPLGDWVACLASQTQALETARRTGSTLEEARALSGMGDAHFMAGRWRTARECFVRCERVSKQVGALELELTSRGMVHLLDALELSFPASALGCQEVAERARASGLHRPEALARLNAAWVLLALGEWETALSEARRAVTLAEDLGAQRFGALGIAYATIASARLGDSEAAHSEVGKALTLARSSSLWFSGPAVYAALLETAENDRLRPLLDEVDTLLESGCLNLSLVTLVPRAIETALELGEPGRAARYAELLERSMHEEPHPLGTLLVDVARTLCAPRDGRTTEDDRVAMGPLLAQLDSAGMRPARALLDRGTGVALMRGAGSSSDAQGAGVHTARTQPRE